MDSRLRGNDDVATLAAGPVWLYHLVKPVQLVTRQKVLKTSLIFFEDNLCNWSKPPEIRYSGHCRS
jgi:hypothetical protein